MGQNVVFCLDALGTETVGRNQAERGSNAEDGVVFAAHTVGTLANNCRGAVNALSNLNLAAAWDLGSSDEVRRGGPGRQVARCHAGR